MKGLKHLEVRYRECVICHSIFPIYRKLNNMWEEKVRCSHCSYQPSNNVYRHNAGYKQQLGNNSLTVIKLRILNPCWSATQIASKLTISRERVRQILSRANLRTTSILRASNTCLYCGKQIKTDRQYCSIKCYSDSRKIDVACDWCGTLVKRSTARLITQISTRNYNHQWCSKSCQGQWLGHNHKPHKEKLVE